MGAPLTATSPSLREELQTALVARHGAENQMKFAQARVGIAGLGGLGSAVAIHLARMGIGTLVLADFDVVDVTNLHRQHYFLDHLGMRKTNALAAQIHAINPFIKLETHPVKVTAGNARTIFAGCDIVCEAFDQADQKAMLVETLLEALPEAKIVSGSGMAGLASANAITTDHVLNNLYVCGDRTSDVAEEGTLISSRVGVCAGHQANMVARLILGKE